MNEPLAYLQDALHAISQTMLYPAIGMLLLMVCYGLFSIGSVLVEYFRERRHFQVAIPRFLRSIEEASADQIPEAVDKSGLLVEQREALLSVFQNRDFDEEALWALAKRLLLQEKQRRAKTVSRNDAIAKLAPMVGLMGTLIPLGPGIVAFGRGDGTVMATAMLIAFDTTVTGLLVAAVMFVIARVRRRWYAAYQASLEAGMTTLLERIAKMRGADGPQSRGSAAAWQGGTPPQAQVSSLQPVAMPLQPQGLSAAPSNYSPAGGTYAPPAQGAQGQGGGYGATS